MNRASSPPTFIKAGSVDIKVSIIMLKLSNINPICINLANLKVLIATVALIPPISNNYSIINPMRESNAMEKSKIFC